MVTVDEEIYRLLPSMVISTVDKWAQLPWRGELHLLFGRAERRCTRHGYRTPDLDVVGDKREADRHARTATLPPAETVTVTPLRPPDLIIQDELHLISGPLGTLVGLYETAVDRLASWDVDGETGAAEAGRLDGDDPPRQRPGLCGVLAAGSRSSHRPSSTSTTRSSRSSARPEDAPGRRYVGICARGLRLKSAEVRVFSTVLARGAEDLRAVRARRRPVDDARRLLQRAAGARRHAPPRRGRGCLSPPPGGTARPRQPQVPRGQGADAAGSAQPTSRTSSTRCRVPHDPAAARRARTVRSTWCWPRT